jgi:hypothetical protein
MPRCHTLATFSADEPQQTSLLRSVLPSADAGVPAKQLAEGKDHDGEGSHMAASVLQAATADRVPFPNLLAHKQVCARARVSSVRSSPCGN